MQQRNGAAVCSHSIGKDSHTQKQMGREKRQRMWTAVEYLNGMLKCTQDKSNLSLERASNKSAVYTN